MSTITAWPDSITLGDDGSALTSIMVTNTSEIIDAYTVEVLGMVPVYIQSTVILIGLLLIYYSRSAKAKGWLA